MHEWSQKRVQGSVVGDVGGIYKYRCIWSVCAWLYPKDKVRPLSRDVSIFFRRRSTIFIDAA